MSLLVSGGAGYIGSQLVRVILSCDAFSDSPSLNGLQTFVKETFSSVLIVDSLLNCGNSSKHVERMIAEHKKAGRDNALEVSLKVGDLRDPVFVESVFTEHKIEAVIHFAAHSCVAESTVDSMKYYENNLKGIMNILQSMSRHGCSNIVFSSTAAVYGEGSQEEQQTKQGIYELLQENTRLHPKNPYGRSKLSCEWIISDQCNSFNRQPKEEGALAKKINGMCLRYFNACGCDKEYGEAHDPETHLIPILLKTFLAKKVNYFLEHVLESPKEEIVQYLSTHPSVAEEVRSASRQREFFTVFGTDYATPDGSAVRDYIHVRDLSIAHVLALRYMYQTDREGVSTFNAFNLGTSKGYSVLEVVQAAQQVVEDDYNAVGSNQPFVKDIEIRNVDRREGDPPVLVADATQAQHKLEWKLHIPKEYDQFNAESSESYLRYIIYTAWHFHKRHPFNYNEHLNELFRLFYQ